MKAPNIIYLQTANDDEPYDEGITWCVDRINESDVKYVKAQIAEERLEALDKLVKAITAGGTVKDLESWFVEPVERVLAVIAKEE